MKKYIYIYHFASALFSKDMLRIVNGFAPWILFDGFEEKFLCPLECREVPSVHEVNPSRDPSRNVWSCDRMDEYG